MEGLAWSGVERDVLGRDRWSGRVIGINRGAAPTSESSSEAGGVRHTQEPAQRLCIRGARGDRREE